jgi:hypothetical protein
MGLERMWRAVTGLCPVTRLIDAFVEAMSVARLR